MAPEILRGEHYQEANDIYSFGMVLYELFTEQIPFREHTYKEIVLRVGYSDNLKLKIERNFDAMLMGLMFRCLSRNRSDRPTFVEIVKIIQEVENRQNFGEKIVDNLNEYFQI